MSAGASSDPCIVSLDVGSSSVRALVFDAGARQMEGFGARLSYRIRTTPDGGAEADPDELARMAVDCLDEVHRQVRAEGMRVAAVAGSAFWHGLMGIGADGRPTVPLIHLFDSRSEDFVERGSDPRSRTGCPPHTSYWPAKLRWLAAARPAEFQATRQWIGFPEYLFAKLFGRARASVSMASATGLWNQQAGDWDPEAVESAGVRRAQLADPAGMDCCERALAPEYHSLWPGFEGAAWFPLLGDGAANNLGTGCVSPDALALMAGTTGALRAVVERMPAIAPELWCYRVDRRRLIAGGALSNGGEVYAWMKRTLALPRDVEARLDTAVPGSHGLAVLPFFCGERTPYWRGDLRAAIAGLSLGSEPFDILRAAMESVALGFRQIYGLLARTMAAPGAVIASGGALLRSPGWTQMMADALGRPVTASSEREASARGAALWAMEQAGMIGSVAALPASNGVTFEPRPQYGACWERLAEQRDALYQKLYGSES